MLTSTLCGMWKEYEKERLVILLMESTAFLTVNPEHRHIEWTEQYWHEI